VLKSLLNVLWSVLVSPREVLASIEEEQPYWESLLYAWVARFLAAIIERGARAIHAGTFDYWDILWVLAVGFFGGILWVLLGALVLTLAALALNGKPRYQAACAAAAFLALSTPVSAGLECIPWVGPLLAHLPALWVVVIGALALMEVSAVANSRAWLLCGLLLAGVTAHAAITHVPALLHGPPAKPEVTAAAVPGAPAQPPKSPLKPTARADAGPATAPGRAVEPPIAPVPDASVPAAPAPDPDWEVTVNSIPPNAEIYRDGTPTLLGLTPTTLRFPSSVPMVPLRLRIVGKEMTRTVTPSDSNVFIDLVSDEASHKKGGPAKTSPPPRKPPAKKPHR
jgi:hypothetical protein